MSDKRFRIAFSFAGEKREFVEKVARLLGDRFGEDAILYDHFFEAKFAKADLAFSLPDLYRDHSDLIVAVLCPDYATKEWCGLEWNAIYSLIKEGKVDQVMLTRYDKVEGKGLYGLAGFVELDHKTPDEAAILILERLADNEGHPKSHYLPLHPSSFSLPTSGIPHNLPTLQPFFGREDELKKIADALDPDSRTWGALIDGPGGMGKTSLAVRAAYDASPEVFKKIVFVSLKTRELDDDGVRDLSGFILSGLVELLNELARELGCDDIAKAPEEQRPRLLLDALRGTQTLLVLDNLESLLKRERDTLFTFVKKLPAGCRAILTSRVRIGSGAEELILQALSEEAALATLAELATHNPFLAKTSAAERLVLYRETAGKPLLLRWTAGQLGRGHCLTFTDALHFIRSCPVGNDPLEFIFGDLVEDFSDAESKVLCALTYFTQPVKVEHIAAIAGPLGTQSSSLSGHAGILPAAAPSAGEPAGWKPAQPHRLEACVPPPAADIQTALRSLVNRSLVVPTDEFQSFTLVPMVADFLRVKKPDVVEETGDRLEKRAYALIIENGWQKYDRFPALEAAWPGIAPALPLFLVGDNQGLQTVCGALRDFLHFAGRWDELLSINQRAEVSAVAAKDYLKAGWRAYDVGRVHERRANSFQIFLSAERAAAHWEKAIAGFYQIAFLLQLRGIGFRINGNYSAAIGLFQDALRRLRTGGTYIHEEAIFLTDLAKAEELAGLVDSAEKRLAEAEPAISTLKCKGCAAARSNLLARIALARRQWSCAERYSRDSLELNQQLRRRWSIGRSSLNLAEALIQQGRNSEAVSHAQGAVELFGHLGSPDLAEAQAILAECKQALAK